MPAFDAYDYVGYVVPGTILLLALMWLFPAIKEQFIGAGWSLSELGVLIILSFACGQLLHQMGHVIDYTPFGRVYYTATVQCDSNPALSKDEKKQLQAVIKKRFEFDVACFGKGDKDAKTRWRDIVKQIYVELHQAKLSERVDIFNRSVGLHLGLGSVFAVLFCLCALVAVGPRVKIKGCAGIRSTLYVADCSDVPKVIALLAALAALSYISFARMDYFSQNYATELLTTYLLRASTAAPL
jgi:hypothetical protein